MGVVVGPHGTGVLIDGTAIAIAAEFGIVLLLFSVGLDFDRDRLRELRRTFGIGTAQIAICIIGGFLAATLFAGVDWRKALLLGFLIAHTSSTLLLKIYQDRGELSTPPARLGLGISITQDLSSVLMLLALPLMAVGNNSFNFDLPVVVLQTVLAVVVLAALLKWVIPYSLKYVIASSNRELLLFYLFLVCIGMSWGAELAGLSAALGAFIAGLAVAGSHYSHQVQAEVAPIRDLLVALFFISVGTLIDISAVPLHLPIVLPLTLLVLVLKFISGVVPAACFGYPLRVSVLTGIAIAQIGEFAFVLAYDAQNLGIIDAQHYQPIIMTAVLTMLISPFMIKWGPALYKNLSRLPFPNRVLQGAFNPDDEDELAHLDNHVVIAGYGLNGRNLVKTLQSMNIEYVALEISPENFEAARREGRHIYFGDCTRLDVLSRVNIRSARVFVVAISDLEATRRAVQTARHESSSLHIIVRTRFVEEIEYLHKIGANEVIPEEFETSLEILARTLHKYHVMRSTIDEFVLSFRKDSYQALRSQFPLLTHSKLLSELYLALEIDAIKVEPRSHASGRKIVELSLPQVTGASILGVQRKGGLTTLPVSTFVIEDGDVVVVAGTHEQLKQTFPLFKATE